MARAMIEMTGGLKMMPAAEGTCEVCATAHEPDYPHNQQSMFYQMVFQDRNGRHATWEDAMAHCEPRMQDAWH